MSIVIIGAGASAAAASLALSKGGRQTVVLEAQGRVGGRIQTLQINNVPVDMGASYIHGFEFDHNPTKLLATELEVQHYISKPEPGLTFTLDDGKAVDGETLAKASEQLAKVAGKATASVRSASGTEDISYGKALYKELSNSPIAIGLARIGELGGLPLEAISTRYYGTDVPMRGVDAMPVGGYQPFLQKAFEKAGADVKLNQQVVEVRRQGDSIHLKTKTGETYQASHVICTVPVTILQKQYISFEPSLPDERLKLIDRTSYGALNKILLVYPSVWWPAKASHFMLLPSSVATSKSDDSIIDILTSGPLFVSNLHVHSADQPPALLCYVGADRAEALEKHTAEQVGRTLHNLLANIVAASNDVTISPPIESAMTKWRTDPFALGAHTGPVAIGQGAEPADYAKLGEPLWDGTLLFAGEHTEKDWRGSVPGALQSGLREADRLLTSLA